MASSLTRGGASGVAVALCGRAADAEHAALEDHAHPPEPLTCVRRQVSHCKLNRKPQTGREQLLHRLCVSLNSRLGSNNEEGWELPNWEEGEMAVFGDARVLFWGVGA